MRIAIDINDVLRDNMAQFMTYYRKLINPDFDIDIKDITSFDFSEVFPFEDEEAYKRFKYEDCPFELYGRAEPVDKFLPYRFNDWTQNTLKDFEDDKIPDVMLFSPLEIGLTIPSTYSFLSKIGSRVREMRFPVDSSSMWDVCDMMITANPNLLSNVPSGKIAVKIETPYNSDIKAEFSYDSMLSLIQDKEERIIKLIENFE